MDKIEVKNKLLDTIKYAEFDDMGNIRKVVGVAKAQTFRKDNEYSVAPKDIFEVLEIRRII